MSNSHVVQRGETLYSIAQQYHLAPNDIMVFNGLKDDHVFYGHWLVIPTHAEINDRRSQMGREKDEAKCDRSPTQRHIFQIIYGHDGQPNYKRGQMVNCEACGRFIKQDGARWVVAPEEEWVHSLLKHPQFVIQEQDTIDELL